MIKEKTYGYSGESCQKCGHPQCDGKPCIEEAYQIMEKDLKKENQPPVRIKMKPKKEKKMIGGWALLHPKGYIYTYWEGTSRKAIYGSERSAEEVNEKLGKRFKVVPVEIKIISPKK